MLKKLLCLFVVALTAGCALPRQINSPEKLSQIRSIAVISALEDRVGLDYVGFTVFHNKEESIPVDWRLNDRVHELAAAALRGRYEVKAFAYDRSAFAGAYTSNDATFGTANEVMARLKQVAKPGIADAFLVIVGRSSGYVSTNRYGNFVGTSFTATVFDGGTLEPIAQAYGGVPCQRTLCLNGYEAPSRRVGFRWSGEPWSQIPLQRKDEIRSIVTQLIDEAVPNTLGRLGLAASPNS